MNNSFARLIDGMCATLRAEVLPRLADEFARGQVYGVINVLNTFKVRADWSAGFLLQQIEAQRQALNAVAQELAQPLPAKLTAPTFEPGAALEPTPIAQLLALRDQGNAQIAALLAWLDTAGAALGAERAARIEAALAQALRAEMEIELRHSSKPMFAQMSGGTQD